MSSIFDWIFSPSAAIFAANRQRQLCHIIFYTRIKSSLGPDWQKAGECSCQLADWGELLRQLHLQILHFGELSKSCARVTPLRGRAKQRYPAGLDSL